MTGSDRVLVLPIVNDDGELVYRYMTGISSGKPKYGSGQVSDRILTSMVTDDGRY